MEPGAEGRAPTARRGLALIAAGIASALVAVVLVGLGSESVELGAVSSATDRRPYSFRYPAGWNRDGGEGFEIVSPGVVVSMPIAYLSDSAPSYGEMPQRDQFWFMAYDPRRTDEDLSPQRLAEDLVGAEGVTDVTLGERTIDGRVAQTVAIALGGPPYEEPLLATYHFVPVGETTILLIAAWSTPSDPDGRVLDAILGSIRFDEVRLAH